MRFGIQSAFGLAIHISRVLFKFSGHTPNQNLELVCLILDDGESYFRQLAADCPETDNFMPGAIENTWHVVNLG